MKYLFLALTSALLVTGCQTRRYVTEEELTEEELTKEELTKVFGPQEAIQVNEQVLAISEVVFKYMFVNAADWDKKISRRFIRIREQCPSSLLDRLRKETGLIILSPFTESEKDYPDGEFFNGSYLANGDDSLFYNISAISEAPDGTVRVWCSVTWYSLGRRGYEYTLALKGGEWTVIKYELKWLS